MAQFEGHFLNCLFPGLEDMPSNFATQSPPLFDNNLPAVSVHAWINLLPVFVFKDENNRVSVVFVSSFAKTI